MIYYIDPLYYGLYIIIDFSLFGVGGYWLWPLSDWDPLFD